MNEPQEKLLQSLTKESPLLLLLRALYSLMVDYAVYLPDETDDIFVFVKEHLVALVERGKSEALVKDLPEMIEEGMIRPRDIAEIGENETVPALLVERGGARVTSLARAVSPEEPEFPEWWSAPLPFAMCARGGLRINETAEKMFVADLERMSVAELPDREEFIVELEGREPPCFLSFCRLEPGVFILDDCTGDLLQAQDVSWWAAVGRTWAASVERGGYTWRREETLPDDFTGQAWPCEWEGRFMGYFCLEEPEKKPEPGPASGNSSEAGKKPEPEPAKKPASRAQMPPKKENEVLKAIGPQTMGLLTAGQVFDPTEVAAAGAQTRKAPAKTAAKAAQASGKAAAKASGKAPAKAAEKAPPAEKKDAPKKA